MAVVATGTLADRPFGRTVAAVAQRQFTGDLRVQAGTQRHTIGFRDGAVVAAEGKHPADSAVKTAMSAGLITSSQASDLLRAIKPDSDEVAVVVEKAKLGGDQAARLRRRVIANRAMRLFALDRGELALDDEPRLALADVAPIDARVIIYMGARAHFADERFARELAMLGDTFRLAADPGALEGFGFGDAERAIVDALATRAVGATGLVQAVPDQDPRMVMAVLYACAVCGLCEISGARTSAPRPAVRATPPVTQPPPATTPRARTPTTPAKHLRTGRAGVDADQIRALVTSRLALADKGTDHFAVLGLAPETPPDAIRAAYFELARQLHPDRITANGLEDIRADAQRLFARINAAFGIVSHPKRRAEYMATLRAGGEEAVRRKQEEADALAARILAAEDHFRTGEMALRRNQLEVAIREFAEAAKLNPDEAEHHALLAWATWCAAPDKIAAGRTARAALDKAAAQSPRNPVPPLLLGKIARTLGDDDEAVKHLRKVLTLSPGHGEASSELRVVESRIASRQPRR